MTQLINSLDFKTGKNGEEIAFEFVTPGEAGVIYKKVREEFEELTGEEVNEAFRNKHVLQMSIVPFKEPGETNIAARITATSYFKPELYEKITEFVKKEFSQSKK